MSNKLIALWTYPRTISTAFERVMMERGDFTIYHEPFSYLYYVKEQKSAISQEFVDSNHPRTYDGIRQMLATAAATAPVFFKDMSNHCIDYILDDKELIARMENTFLIRNPEKTIASYYALNPEVRLEEIGCEDTYRHYRAAAAIMEGSPVVIDADDLEDQPERVVRAYCEAVGIAFIPEALQWSPKKEDKWKIWEKWHEDAAQSTGIQKNVEHFDVTIHDDDQLRRYYDHHYPFYEKLYNHRLTV